MNLLSLHLYLFIVFNFCINDKSIQTKVIGNQIYYRKGSTIFLYEFRFLRYHKKSLMEGCQSRKHFTLTLGILTHKKTLSNQKCKVPIKINGLV